MGEGQLGSMQSKMNVVIIGGGYSTMTLLHALNKQKRDNMAVTLIEPKSDAFLAVGAPRALVDPEFAAKSFVPYSQLFDGTHLKKYVEEVSLMKRLVYMYDTEEPIDYDILVIATGRAYQKPFRFAGWRTVNSNDRLEMSTSQESFHPEVFSTDQLLEQLSQSRKELEQSDRVAVVGGGATGVEQAAEIAAAYPNKQVELHHSKSKLLHQQSELTDDDRKTIQKRLEKMGVKVVLGQRFDMDEARVEGGPFVIQAFGGQPNSEFLPVQVRTESGLVKCNEQLNVVGQKYVFAMGDIVFGADASIKTAQYLHAPVVAYNVDRLVRGKGRLKSVGNYPLPLKNLFTLSLGPNDSFGKGALGAMARKMKQKDMMLSSTKKRLGIEEK